MTQMHHDRGYAAGHADGLTSTHTDPLNHEFYGHHEPITYTPEWQEGYCAGLSDGRNEAQRPA